MTARGKRGNDWGYRYTLMDFSRSVPPFFREELDQWRFPIFRSAMRSPRTTRMQKFLFGSHPISSLGQETIFDLFCDRLIHMKKG